MDEPMRRVTLPVLESTFKVSLCTLRREPPAAADVESFGSDEKGGSGKGDYDICCMQLVR